MINCIIGFTKPTRLRQRPASLFPLFFISSHLLHQKAKTVRFRFLYQVEKNYYQENIYARRKRKSFSEDSEKLQTQKEFGRS